MTTSSAEMQITAFRYEHRLRDIEYANQELENQEQSTYNEEEKTMLQEHLKAQKDLANKQLARIKKRQVLDRDIKKLRDKIIQARNKNKFKKASKLESLCKLKIAKQIDLDDKINHEIKSPSNEFTNKTIGDPCVPCMIKQLKKKIKIKGEFPGRQQYSNCGVQSSLYVMKLVSCPGDIEGLDEETLLDDSMDAGHAHFENTRLASGATNPSGVEDIMNDKDVSSSQVPYSREVLCDELKNDRPTILNVDAKDLHPATDENGDSILTGWEGNAGGGHAVTAVDGQFDDQGKLTKVLISDTGNGINGMQYWMKIEDLEIAIDNNPGALAENRMRAAANQPLERSTINVINHPIKTDCP